MTEKRKKPKRKLNSVTPEFENEALPKDKGGRPTKYSPEYPALVRDFLAGGKFYFQFAQEVKVNVVTLFDWEAAHPEFHNAKKEGEKIRNSWWLEGQAVANLKNPNFNVGLFSILSRNIGGWRTRDPVERGVEGEGGTVLTVNIVKRGVGVEVDDL